MNVISVPARLRLATFALLVCVPLAALQTILATRAPWWKLPYRSIGVWVAAVALICLPLSAWLSYGKRWALGLSAVFATLWIFMSAWIAIRMRYPALGFFALLLLVFFTTILLWIRLEMSRSFFDPQLAWYQSVPKPIPGLKCSLHFSEKKVVEARAGRLDGEGVFLFLEPQADSDALNLRRGQKLELQLAFRERSVKCQAVPMRALENGIGAGFQFREMSPDLKKELGDFLELLRGEGYV